MNKRCTVSAFPSQQVGTPGSDSVGMERNFTFSSQIPSTSWNSESKTGKSPQDNPLEKFSHPGEYLPSGKSVEFHRNLPSRFHLGTPGASIRRHDHEASIQTHNLGAVRTASRVVKSEKWNGRAALESTWIRRLMPTSQCFLTKRLRSAPESNQPCKRPQNVQSSPSGGPVGASKGRSFHEKEGWIQGQQWSNPVHENGRGRVLGSNDAESAFGNQSSSSSSSTKKITCQNVEKLDTMRPEVSPILPARVESLLFSEKSPSLRRNSPTVRTSYQNPGGEPSFPHKVQEESDSTESKKDVFMQGVNHGPSFVKATTGFGPLRTTLTVIKPLQERMTALPSGSTPISAEEVKSSSSSSTCRQDHFATLPSKGHSNLHLNQRSLLCNRFAYDEKDSLECEHHGSSHLIIPQHVIASERINRSIGEKPEGSEDGSSGTISKGCLHTDPDKKCSGWTDKLDPVRVFPDGYSSYDCKEEVHTLRSHNFQISNSEVSSKNQLLTEDTWRSTSSLELHRNFDRASADAFERRSSTVDFNRQVQDMAEYSISQNVTAPASWFQSSHANNAARVCVTAAAVGGEHVKARVLERKLQDGQALHSLPTSSSFTFKLESGNLNKTLEAQTGPFDQHFTWTEVVKDVALHSQSSSRGLHSQSGSRTASFQFDASAHVDQPENSSNSHSGSRTASLQFDASAHVDQPENSSNSHSGSRTASLLFDASAHVDQPENSSNSHSFLPLFIKDSKEESNGLMEDVDKPSLDTKFMPSTYHSTCPSIVDQHLNSQREEGRSGLGIHYSKRAAFCKMNVQRLSYRNEDKNYPDGLHFSPAGNSSSYHASMQASTGGSQHAAFCLKLSERDGGTESVEFRDILASKLSSKVWVDRTFPVPSLETQDIRGAQCTESDRPVGLKNSTEEQDKTIPAVMLGKHCCDETEMFQPTGSKTQMWLQPWHSSCSEAISEKLSAPDRDSREIFRKCSSMGVPVGNIGCPSSLLERGNYDNQPIAGEKGQCNADRGMAPIQGLPERGSCVPSRCHENLRKSQVHRHIFTPSVAALAVKESTTQQRHAAQPEVQGLLGVSLSPRNPSLHVQVWLER